MEGLWKWWVLLKGIYKQLVPAISGGILVALAGGIVRAHDAYDVKSALFAQPDGTAIPILALVLGQVFTVGAFSFAVLRFVWKHEHTFRRQVHPWTVMLELLLVLSLIICAIWAPTAVWHFRLYAFVASVLWIIRCQTGVIMLDNPNGPPKSGFIRFIRLWFWDGGQGTGFRSAKRWVLGSLAFGLLTIAVGATFVRIV